MPGFIPFTPPPSTAAALPSLAFAGNILKDETGATWLWDGTHYVRAGTASVGTGIDGGTPSSNYGGTTPIDGGTP